MRRLRRNLLPIVLAALPFLVVLLAALSTLDVFAGLRGVAEILVLVFFLPAVAFYDRIGLIDFNILGGDPVLFGSTGAADATYVLSTSLVLFVAGQLLLRLLRRWLQ